jgi:hypothetical protein
MKQQDEVVESSDVTDSEELLARIAASRVALEAVVGSLSDADLTRPHPTGGWPIVGHLTHLAAWERMIAAHLTDSTDHRVVRMTPADYERSTLDELNARIYEMHRTETPAEARREFEEAHRAILRCIATLTSERLAAPYWPAEARSVANKIAGDTYLHYEEHRVWILEMFDGRTRPTLG